ncbi:MAG TPA: alpha/beta hydrolase-fold protein [Gemmataceae bacterium]|nr:alpha/beta hydrolase-fold protein [Gemmataceae bacterium]
MRALIVCVALLALPPLARADVDTKPRVDENGFRCHRVMSEYQGGVTEIKVLVPDQMEPGKRYPVVYVLPVEAGNGKQYGNGLVEIKKRDLHNKFGVICVEITFSLLPWYADHPTDPKIRQETYILKVVLPFIEQHYPVIKGRAGRLLLGFSKSGYGAFSLLLRHPDVFAKAAAWDAPFMMAAPNRFGMDGIYGNQENFEKYRLTKLMEQRAKDLGKPPRLAILGYDNFRSHHTDMQTLMQRLGIPHEYRDEKKSPHTWHSGWVKPGVAWLVGSGK